MLFLKLRNLAPGFWLLCSLLGSVTFGLRYDYGDGTYYVGNVDNDGKPNGRGQFYNSSGSLEYEGEFFDGLPHGQGTWFGADGSILKGQFSMGHSEGPGILVNKNGDRFEGDFLDRLPHGKVVFVKNPSAQNDMSDDSAQDLVTRIDGEFRHGMPHGEVTVWYGKDNAGTGTESGLKNGVRIEGTFRMGRPHGHARVIDLTSEDEKVLYDGKFLNGRPMDAGDEDDPERELLFKKIGLLNN